MRKSGKEIGQSQFKEIFQILGINSEGAARPLEEAVTFDKVKPKDTVFYFLVILYITSRDYGFWGKKSVTPWTGRLASILSQ